MTVRPFDCRHEAEFMRGVLEGRGIEAVGVSDDRGSVGPALGVVRGIHLQVGTEHAEQAQRQLNADSG